MAQYFAGEEPQAPEDCFRIAGRIANPGKRGGNELDWDGKEEKQDARRYVKLGKSKAFIRVHHGILSVHILNPGSIKIQ